MQNCYIKYSLTKITCIIVNMLGAISKQIVTFARCYDNLSSLIVNVFKLFVGHNLKKRCSKYQLIDFHAQRLWNFRIDHVEFWATQILLFNVEYSSRFSQNTFFRVHQTILWSHYLYKTAAILMLKVIYIEEKARSKSIAIFYINNKQIMLHAWGIKTNPHR